MLLNKFPNQIVKTDKLVPVKNLSVVELAKKNLGKIRIETFKNEAKPNQFITLLRDKSNNILGKDFFAYEENNPNATELYIETIPLLRQKGFGLGEVLRLFSIIFILKNKIEEVEMFSKSGAVYFHSKYNFEPAIKNFEERNFALKNIIRNCQNELQEYKLKAEDLLKRCEQNKSAEEQRNLCKETNILLKKYINEVLQTKDKYKSHSFDYGFRMVLKTEDIRKNNAFFNNLFKKHGIDYVI